MNIRGLSPHNPSPAHDIGTLNTVVQRALQITRAMKQKHVVLTVHEALLPNLMQLKWSVPEYKEVLIPRLGRGTSCNHEFSQMYWVTHAGFWSE